MNETEEPGRKAGWGELGHRWITAIAALITALAGAGFFIGRSTAPEGSASASDTTTTVTATVTVRQDPADVANGNDTTTDDTERTAADAEELWSGKLEWSGLGTGYNLDVVPPTYTEGRYLTAFYDSLESYGDAAKLVVWKSGSVPGKAECAAAVEEEGTDRINTLVRGNLVCGRTHDGNTFRLKITSSGSDVRADAVVWRR